MSAEILTVLGSFGALLATVVAGFGWVVTRMDHGFARVDERFSRVDERLDAQTHELTEVKVAVARLEGPRPRFVADR